MRLLIAVVAVLGLCGCAAQNEISQRQREAESNAPDLSFQGPLRSVNLSPAQVKLVQQGIAQSLKDPASAIFGSSYRAGVDKDREIAVCGFVNGKRFVGIRLHVSHARSWRLETAGELRATSLSAVSSSLASIPSASIIILVTESVRISAMV